MTIQYGEISWERMVRAVEKVRQRLEKAASVLQGAGIPYAIAGGNAVAAWVSRVDEAAVRNTQDVDILIRRADLPVVIQTMEAAGFIYKHAMSIDMFLDRPGGSPRDAVHLLFADEYIRPGYHAPAPSVDESEESRGHIVLSLEAIVRMKLTSYRRKDQVHLLDMINVELLDETWPARFPPELGERLQKLLDDPDG